MPKTDRKARNHQNLWQKFSRFFSQLWKGKTLQVVIAYTTDVHGSLLSYDYVLNKPTTWGLTRIATRIRQLRKQFRHVLFLDNGDIIQGSPLTYYYNFVQRKGMHPVARAMNALRYDVTCVGNHDIEQGPTVYRRVRKQLAFPWLSANALTRRKKSFFQPYTLREIKGLRIAILGMTTPAIPLWLNPDLYPGIYWQDMKESAAGWLAYLKQKKKADVVVGLFHAGIHPNANKPGWPENIPEENPCLQIARELPDYDVILTGHEHRVYNSQRSPRPEEKGLKPLVLMAGSHARHLGVVYLNFRRKNGRWQLEHKKGEIESMRQVPEDDSLRNMLEPYHQKVMRYVNSQIGYAQEEISSHHSRLKDGPFLNLIHQAQLDYTKTQVSLAASFTTTYVLRRGPIRIRDVYGLYKYENYLYIVILSGAQLKEHLEWTSQYFHTVDPQNPFAGPLINRDFMGFNFDTARGVCYEIDITRPVGERIQNLRWPKNQAPVKPGQTFKVVVNSYRAQQLRLRFGCRIIWRSNKEIRDILVEYIKKKKTLTGQVEPCWKIVPEWIIEEYIQHHFNPLQQE